MWFKQPDVRRWKYGVLFIVSLEKKIDTFMSTVQPSRIYEPSPEKTSPFVFILFKFNSEFVILLHITKATKQYS